mmetsp:Transcript_33860/g.54876  ORF Transcript_33860/g.54876 Transcript_33860/m.54876 type:complete len:183 (-) Transcript_33860:492-1040(-)
MLIFSINMAAFMERGLVHGMMNEPKLQNYPGNTPFRRQIAKLPNALRSDLSEYQYACVAKILKINAICRSLGENRCFRSERSAEGNELRIVVSDANGHHIREISMQLFEKEYRSLRHKLASGQGNRHGQSLLELEAARSMLHDDPSAAEAELQAVLADTVQLTTRLKKQLDLLRQCNVRPAS